MSHSTIECGDDMRISLQYSKTVLKYRNLSLAAVTLDFCLVNLLTRV